MSAPIWHILTSEYPPELGGVSDFAAVLASVLPGEVHVWTPGKGGDDAAKVHRIGGRFDRAARAKIARGLDAMASPRVLLLQWVPHGFGWRSMNVAFCLWVWRRVKFHGDALEMVIHEPFLSDVRNLRQRIVAIVHRLMITVLFNAARRVHVSIPAWRESVARFAFGRDLGFGMVPITPRIAPVNDSSAVDGIRERYAGQGRLIGHFGAGTGAVLPMIERLVPLLLREIPDACFLLIGADSGTVRDVLARSNPALEARIFATGPLSDRDVSLHLQACDLLVQPYPDGVSSRRTSATAVMRHGACMVTTSGHLTELFWSEEEAVALAPVDDLSAQVRRTKALLADDIIRGEIGMRARDVYERRFSADQLAEVFRNR